MCVCSDFFQIIKKIRESLNYLFISFWKKSGFIAYYSTISTAVSF